MEYLDPSLSTAPFTVEEDNLIVQYHDRYGNKWKRIADDLNTRRSATAVKIRYYQLQRDVARLLLPRKKHKNGVNTASVPVPTPPVLAALPQQSRSTDGGLNYWLSQVPSLDGDLDSYRPL